jgi:hypothetical protein
MIYETFAYRKRRQNRGAEPEIYTYNQAPAQLRHQICMVLSDGIGLFRGLPEYPGPNADDVWSDIDNI